MQHLKEEFSNIIKTVQMLLHINLVKGLLKYTQFLYV